ncbi:HEAT repeat domain-containing protein [Paenibacillus sp. CGMCC 1.16610]|uniref:Phytanoyl-CoA dioxygenase n=1 Tax=Paenibacillus anseongense TaxID=2682845 RepID=A0ABW9UBJ0_9BACL|nr:MULTISPECIES: HEAT repeat domain-containing protein [Paenibacillus]MBA2938390.1 HEAT repeat domain-containing protein [Paenibacillus sp. CGMCC 1.16610]MVQ37449.1 phytanoyl-CoA dioxygenase [Paenibacillus anseongense]
MQEKQPLLLTDEQMREFITNGCLILKTDFSHAFHDNLLEQLNTVYAEEGNPGNNLLPRIRELQKVFDHPVVTGALTSVLGPNYMMHAHRHGHFNALPTAGGWHKDSYWGYDRVRNHHPNWAMIMYFPQDTPVDLGPTGIMPGTQNHQKRAFEANEHPAEVLASGEAGTFALIHYDIWHRSTPNILGKPRYMLKFEFMRTELPKQPSWNNQEREWKKPANLLAPLAAHDLMWEETWNWLSGELCSLAGTASSEPQEVQELAGKLSGDETIAINASYDLARRGQAGVNALLDGLRSDDVHVSRISAYGLAVAGSEAVDGLIAALNHENVNTVTHAVFALGELSGIAAKAVPALTELLDHPEDKIRSAVVDALGFMNSPVEDVVASLTRGLQDQNAQVRFMSSLSLSRLGASAESAVPQLEIALDDENRYVRAHAAETLHYIGTDRAKNSLIRFLLNNRWCSTTTKANAFYP